MKFSNRVPHPIFSQIPKQFKKRFTTKVIFFMFVYFAGESVNKYESEMAELERSERLVTEKYNQTKVSLD